MCCHHHHHHIDQCISYSLMQLHLYLCCTPMLMKFLLLEASTAWCRSLFFKYEINSLYLIPTTACIKVQCLHFRVCTTQMASCLKIGILLLLSHNVHGEFIQNVAFRWDRNRRRRRRSNRMEKLEKYVHDQTRKPYCHWAQIDRSHLN